MNRRLNELFAEWYACLKARMAGRFYPVEFVTDGFYPRCTEQKKKIYFFAMKTSNPGRSFEASQPSLGTAFGN
jgi:hypothetical protein